MMFNPLTGEEIVDVHEVEQALSRLMNGDRLKDDHRGEFVPWKTIDERQPDEIIVICLCKSTRILDAADFREHSSPRPKSKSKLAKFKSRFTGLPRLPSKSPEPHSQAVKGVVDMFLDRTMAYHHAHHIGLASFYQQNDFTHQITSCLEDLRDAMATIKVGSTAALSDALVRSKALLLDYEQKYPTAKKRILILCDGYGNTDNENRAWEVCRDLQVFRVFKYT
jgi:hypothetical protein